MAGVSYDMGDVVADLGYRGIYMNKVMSQPDAPNVPYIINDNYIHEVRGTVRYRFN
jgi:opacity protein-like surface antigen